MRQVVVQHELDALHVDAARGDVGRKKDAVSAVPKSFKRFFPLGKRAVRVQFRRSVAQGADAPHHPFDAELRAQKDEHRAAVFSQYFFQKPRLVAFLHEEEFVGDVLRGGARRRDLDARGELHMRPRDRDDILRHRRGEKQRLALARHGLEDALQLRRESHVEHPIRFIKHKDADRSQRKRFLLHVVDDPPGRANHDLRIPPERLDLPEHGLAADHDRRPHAERRADLAEDFMYLERELPRG